MGPQLKDIEYVLSHKGFDQHLYVPRRDELRDDGGGKRESTGNYRGNVTSYDYDAPLDEAGHPTPKFFAYRDLILKYTGMRRRCRCRRWRQVVAIPEFDAGSSQDLRCAVAAGRCEGGGVG